MFELAWVPDPSFPKRVRTLPLFLKESQRNAIDPLPSYWYL